jgi:hypothetical protein
MRYRISGGGWPVGAQLIPAATEVNTELPDWKWLEGVPPPIDCIPLSQDTYDHMIMKLKYPKSAVRPVPQS